MLLMPPLDDSLLQPLRAYPRELVLVCAALVLAVGLWAMAKIAKWAIYLLALVIFTLALGGAALWLWD